MDLMIINNVINKKPSKLLGSLLLFLLTSCSTPYQAPVNDVGDTSGNIPNVPIHLKMGPNHRVNGGETLYSIAWMYDLDYSALAIKNQISAPYIIYPGQVLSLEIDSAPAPSRVLKPTASRAQPVTRTAPTVRQTTSTRAASTTSNSSTTQATGTGVSPGLLRWNWPANGNIIGRFSSGAQENKGIDIAGKEGDKVFAAEAGEVVYAGSGLLHYGDLIIIKHNTQYLSAYAHNSKLDVKEGDRVSRGQKIAALGSTGINREMLHFEIRLNGKPVDPLRYLPSR